MPDIVNDDELSSLAAEYVLGTLDANERTRANVLLDVDHQFLSMVRIWERRLGELHLMVEPVEPEAKIWTRIRGKLKNVAPIAVAPPPVPAPPPAVPKMPAAAPFPAPVEPKPALAATATGHKLAGLIQEVEKLTADTKLAEQKIVEVKPDEPTLAPLTEPEQKAVDVPPVVSEAAAAKRAEPEQPVQAAAAAELRPIEVLTAVLEPRPTVAELAAKLAPEPAAPAPVEPRPVDRVRREPSTSPLPDAARKQSRPVRDRTARPARVGLWRSIAALMLLVSIALGSLIASWRYIPERLPARLRPTAVLNLSEVTSSLSRKPALFEAQFDE
jgi:anti-sigma-K factor RskA